MKLIQGDVILRKVEGLPTDATLVTDKAVVLQESEVTGHHHHFRGNAAVALYQSETAAEQLDGVTTITPNLGKFIVVGPEGATLYHGKGFEDDPASTGNGDHKALQVGAGVWEIDIVREWDYDSQEVTRVVD